jgi:hypothetical protein
MPLGRAIDARVRRREILQAFTVALAVVLLTRLPVARTHPVDYDEGCFLVALEGIWFPMHHTLFMTAGKALGLLFFGDVYPGFIVLDMAMSVLALVASWWWLRTLVSPVTACAGSALLCFGPNFWGYGAMAANYTGIIAVGSMLLGIAWRGRSDRQAWQPYVAAALLAVGTGYRQDIGVYWAPIAIWIFWQHRWIRSMQAICVGAVIGFAWIIPMLHDAGGWEPFRRQSAEFSYTAGYLNSIWALGPIDSSLRYSVKLGMALLLTLGLFCLWIPAGVASIWRGERGRIGLWMLVLSTLPALGFHLLIHFGVPGYCFHYIPALLALAAVGLESAAFRATSASPGKLAAPIAKRVAICAIPAICFFWCYPVDFADRGLKGDFDLAFGRLTRSGLASERPERDPQLWRTLNSNRLAEDDAPRPQNTRRSIGDVMQLLGEVSHGPGGVAGSASSKRVDVNAPQRK